MAFDKKFKLSIIAPFYNEQDVIKIFFAAMIPILKGVAPQWEILCIDDGSHDKTLEILKEYAKNNDNIKVLSFSRNFGKEAALTCGLLNATGDCVIPIDADLQDPPELIPLMVSKWLEGYDVVLAKRTKRDDGFLRSKVADLYYYLLNKLTHGTIPKNVGDFRLIDRKVIDVLNLMTEKSRYMKGIFAWVGFKTTVVKYNRPKRVKGEAKQSVIKLWNLALNGLFSFSTTPLRMWLYIGLFISALAFGFALWLVLKTMLFGKDFPGYASIMVTMLFMNGMNFISLGIIGEYVARVYKEVKNRPLFILKESYGLKEKAAPKKAKKQ
jgi:glycosyltransferase involved in cell wall biosynthesis